MPFYVVDNVTGQRVSKTFETEDSAVNLCSAMNSEYGPGGKFGISETIEVPHCKTCRCS